MNVTVTLNCWYSFPLFWVIVEQFPRIYQNNAQRSAVRPSVLVPLGTEGPPSVRRVGAWVLCDQTESPPFVKRCPVTWKERFLLLGKRSLKRAVCRELITCSCLVNTNAANSLGAVLAHWCLLVSDAARCQGNCGPGMRWLALCGLIASGQDVRSEDLAAELGPLLLLEHKVHCFG